MSNSDEGIQVVNRQLVLAFRRFDELQVRIWKLRQEGKDEAAGAIRVKSKAFYEGFDYALARVLDMFDYEVRDI